MLRPRHGAWWMSSSSVENADEKAGTQLERGSVAATCATGSCPPPPGCNDIIAKIKELTGELAKRRGDMLADRPVSQGGLGMYELFLKDPLAKVPDPRGIKPDLGNWDGHRRQILEKQQNAKRELKKHKEKKCGALPSGAETQAELPPPTRPFGH